MLREYENLYNDDVLAEAIRRFGIDAGGLTLLDGQHSLVYDCRRGEESLILKITHTLHRSRENIMGELEFVNYVVEGGVAAPRAVSSLRGNLVEVLEAKKGSFLAYAYEKAPGSLVDWRHWKPELFEEWGAVVGRMHALTKRYEPSSEAIRRRFWHEDRDWQLQDHPPGMPSFILDETRRAKEWLMALPQDKDSFGLIHSDLHQWNFFVHDGTIRPFDFDNAHYDWFLADLSTVLQNVILAQARHYERGEYEHWTGGKKMDGQAFLTYFMESFMAGYREQNSLPAHWLNKLPEFLHIRYLTMYWDKRWAREFEELSEQEQASDFPWRTVNQLYDELADGFWRRYDFTQYS
ncbi:MAG: phosphotransferase [Chloroflexi bacterium]|nr:phosphotransferase [Chloroflexota bacterium]